MSEAAPTYGSHTGDQLIPQNEASQPQPAHTSMLSGLTDIPASKRPENATEPSQAPPATETPFPKAIVIDKDLIFPSTPPATALYSLNFTLQSHGNQIMISRSVPGTIRADGTARKVVDKPLYELSRPPLDYTTFHIRGQRKSTYPGTGELKLGLGLKGSRWELRYGKEVVLKCRDGVWVDGSGSVVATEKVMPDGKGSRTESDTVKDNQQAQISMEEGLGVLMLDLIVAAWCARVWWVESKANKVKTMSTSDTIRHRLKSGSNIGGSAGGLF